MNMRFIACRIDGNDPSRSTYMPESKKHNKALKSARAFRKKTGSFRCVIRVILKKKAKEDPLYEVRKVLRHIP